MTTPPILDHMAALADPIRCRMLLPLERHELTVNEICSVLQLPQSTVSRHLKTLADDGWVTSRRDGTSRFYGMAMQDLDPGAQRLWPLIRELIAPHVAKVVAVDGSTDMVQAARKRLKGLHQVEVRRGDMEALPIDDGQLDVAIVALVLHHVPDPARALAEIHRVLKRGGRAMIVDMLPHDRVEYQQQMGHVWLGFTEKTLTKMLEG